MLKEKVFINGIEYYLVGDFYVPYIPSDTTLGDIGYYGEKHLSYLKEHDTIKYAQLIREDGLKDYLLEVNDHANAYKKQLLEEAFMDNCSLFKLKEQDFQAWLKKIHEIYTEIEAMIRFEIVYK